MKSRTNATYTQYRFVPQEDITAFELAILLPWISRGAFPMRCIRR